MNTEIENLLLERGCQIIRITNKSTPIEYICKCGKQRKQLFSDFKRRNCRYCKIQLQSEETYDDIKEEEIVEETGEIWRRVVGGWISSWGRAKNKLGKLLTLCPTKYRYRINKKHQYASRLVAVAFKIENYEKILDGTQKWCVSHYDKNRGNNRVENLYIRSKVDINKHNGKKSHKQNNRILPTLDNVKDMEFRYIPEISEIHKFYKNGKVYNGARFLEFSRNKSDKYFSISRINNINKSYKVHRLICYAFHPLPDKMCLNDYKNLQVNHIDGNTFNNHADNLEWTTQSQNMLHAYDTKLNTKTRHVLQYDIRSGKLLSEYPSIAQASRQTGIPEHRIREIAKNNGVYSDRLYNWKMRNPELNNEYTRKYASS